MTAKRILYAQSGGPTAVINASARGVIEAARAAGIEVWAAQHGLIGVLEGEGEIVTSWDEARIAAISNQPGAAFGSCRFDLDELAGNPAQYDQLFAVLKQYEIGGFLLNGGNGSMDTLRKVDEAARARGYPLVCVGIPKTVDNDLLGTDCSPGYGSAAKYVATAMREAWLDFTSMYSEKNRVFIFEVMGRNAGWLAAATALARHSDGDVEDAPQIILLPERAVDPEQLVAKVADCFQRNTACALTVSEGVCWTNGRLVAERMHDAVGHVQLGGAGAAIAALLEERLGIKYHYCLPDYLQRAGRHLASAVDLEQAIAVGREAVACVQRGDNGVMVTLERLSEQPYRWGCGQTPLVEIANLERKLPDHWITPDGMNVTAEFVRYVRPLIQGEAFPRFVDGLPA